jgi:putative FmdB family regulatory protein
MPLFEYFCADCGVEFEKLVPSYKSMVECTHCSSSKIEKKLSVFSVAGEHKDSFVEGSSCGSCGSDTPGLCGMN